MRKIPSRFLRLILCTVLIILVGTAALPFAAHAQISDPPPGVEDPGTPPPARPAVSREPDVQPPDPTDEIPASLLPSGGNEPLVPYLPPSGENLDQPDPSLESIIPFGGGGCTPPPGEWKQAAPLSSPGYGQAVASDGVYVYAAGGDFGAGSSNQFYRFNPRTNTWDTLAPLPTAVNTGLMVYAEGRLYVLGGYITASEATDMVQIYAIAQGTWSTAAPLPGVRAFLAGGYSQGKIYAAGGVDSVSSTTARLTTWEYSINANTWSAKTNLPAEVSGAGSAVINGYLYLFGGRNSVGTTHNKVYEYNIALNSWLEKAPLPTAVNYPGTAVYGERAWVFGGGDPFTGLTNTQIYDPASNLWSSGPVLNVGRSFQGGAVVRNKIVSVGGYTTSSSSNFVEVATQNPIRVLIVYSDDHTPPTDLQFSLLAQPGIGQVDTFDAQSATPTLAQLLAYDVVVPFSNSYFASAEAMGNVLADYQDGGGIVVAFAFDWLSSYGIAGRWLSGGYTPFNSTTTSVFTNVSLGTIHRAGHPLMAGVSTLGVYHHLSLTLAPGASVVASWNDGQPLLAYKGRAVGINAYVGSYNGIWSGDFASIIANAGYMLRRANGSCASLVCQGPTIIHDSISVTDAVQTGRLNRYDPPPTCAAPNTCPLSFDTVSRHFDLYSFWNNTNATQCVKVTLDAGSCSTGQNVQSSAYLDYYDAANLCTNYLSDIGATPLSSKAYSFEVPAWRNYIIVVNEAFSGSYCPAYTLTVAPSTCPIKEVNLPVILR
jgi:hypothetical protein